MRMLAAILSVMASLIFPIFRASVNASYQALPSFSLVTLINRAGPWSTIPLDVYYPYLSSQEQLNTFVSELSTPTKVRPYCEYLQSYCDNSISAATASSDGLVRVYAQSVANVCCAGRFTLPLATTAAAASRPAGAVQCAQVKPQPLLEARIVGGRAADQCEFPNIVAIYRDGGFHCAGSILDNNRIMTAAHCLKYSSTYEVHAGKYYSDKDSDMKSNPNLQIVPVSRVVVNPIFDALNYVNDIAIAYLSVPLRFTSCVMPTCLPSRRDYDFSSKCIVVGWGKLSSGGTSPLTLQKVQVPAFSTQSCKATFASYYTRTVTEGVICAAAMEGGVDACQGDSGGIMMCLSQDRSYKQYGLVSSGLGCAVPGSPGLYTDVAYYLPFINSN